MKVEKLPLWVEEIEYIVCPPLPPFFCLIYGKTQS